MRRSLIPTAIACFALTFASAEAEPVKLTIAPAKPPAPALHYQLLPEVRDLTSGNAATQYYRTFSPDGWRFLSGEEHQGNVTRWLEMSMEDFKALPKDKLFKPETLKGVDIGARRTYCDWDLLERVKREGVSLPLPDVQGFREISRLLSLRARREIADGDFSDAVFSLQTSLQFSRHISEGPSLIHSLIALANTQITLIRIEDLMEADGPNLYWALSNLPSPFIDLRTGLEAERFFLDATLPGLRDRIRDLKSGPMSEEEAHKLFDRLQAIMPLTKKDDWRIWRASLVMMAEKIHPKASKYLIQQGRERDVVEKMPVLQVALMYAVEEYDRLYDEIIKWQFLPFAERREKRETLQEMVEKLKKERLDAGGFPLAELILPAIYKVDHAQVKIDRRIAALRTIEAIRLHAAENKGKPPTTLADIKAVPVPKDPLTGKDFVYKVDGMKFTLEGPAPEWAPPKNAMTLKYEITLRSNNGN